MTRDASIYIDIQQHLLTYVNKLVVFSCFPWYTKIKIEMITFPAKI